MKVLIDNPTQGGQRFTTPRKAEKYVRHGRAKYVTPTLIRFIATDFRNVAVTSAVSLRRLQATHYDGVQRLMTYREMRAIPILMPTKMLNA